MIIIKEIATGKEWKVPDEVPDFLSVTMPVIFLGLNYSGTGWGIDYKYSDTLTAYLRLDAEKYSVIDTDYISKSKVIEVIEEVFEGKVMIPFLLDKMGIDRSLSRVK